MLDLYSRFILTGCLMLSGLCSFGQDLDYCKEADRIIFTLESNHFQPRELDEAFSQEVFEELIDVLDPHHTFFTKESLRPIKHQATGISKQIKAGSCLFLTELTEIYRSQLAVADSIVRDIESRPLDFKQAHFVNFSPRDTTWYPKDDDKLANWWLRRIKYYVLLDMMDSELATKADDYAAVMAKEKDFRQKICSRELCNIQRKRDHTDGLRTYVGDQFLQVLSTQYDPHTNYFSARDMASFETSLSKQSYSFGFDLNKNSAGDIVIERLAPGGPAWKSNELHKGDVLVSVQFPGEEPMELLCTGVYELQNLLATSRSSSITLTVKKNNGKSRTVTLRKEVMEVEENVINGFVLNGDKKIGYLYLPGFYTEWENENQLGCANDLAKELIKLQMESTEGLILDLRFNGGGSMKEALDLAGIFIDEGPLSISETRTNGSKTLKDSNRGSIYDGPLVILVNKASASASEIFAAALQDYHRAVIVGSPTYGKSTGQIILPLDRTANRDGGFSGSNQITGYLKVTMQTFHRVTGETHQQTGVIPDIELPDVMTHFIPGEVSEKNALSFGQLEGSPSLTYKPLNPLPLAALKSKSFNRVSDHERFKRLTAINDSLPGIIHKKMRLALNLPAIEKAMKPTHKTVENASNIDVSASQSYRVANNSYSQSILELNPDLQDMNDALVDKIQNDIYIEEAYFILLDLLEIE